MPRPDSQSAWASEDRAVDFIRRLLPMRMTSRPLRDPTITGSTVIGRRTTGGMPGLPGTGIGSNSARDTKSSRILTTGSTIAMTREALLAASTKRVATSVGRIAAKRAESLKASRAILGGIKPRIRTVETATGPVKTRVVKATAKKAVLQTDSEAANRRIYEQPLD